MIPSSLRTSLRQKLYRHRWNKAYKALREPKTQEPLLLDEASILQQLEKSPLPVTEYEVDVNEYHKWMAEARYEQHHPGYYSHNLHEKSLEHYVAAQLLELKSGKVYVDIASQHGAAAEIYTRIHGVTSYLQDLDFPPGLNGNRIGGDAAQMPVPDNFADAMALHCSFEHFEGDSDSLYVVEVQRVLKPGGVCVIVPLYLCHQHSCLTDPVMSVPGKVSFDPDAVIHASRDWHNRHGRFYGIPQLIQRVWNHRGELEMTLLVVPNYRDVHPSCYLRYALVIRKP